MKYSILAVVFSLFFSSAAFSQNDVVDVFFVAGQSNAGNFGELNSYDFRGFPDGAASVTLNENDAMRSDQGFGLTAARIPDRTNRGLVSTVADSFTDESFLDPGQFATDRLGVNLNAITGNDIALFNFARNGRPIANLDDALDAGESWSPSAGELYTDFQDYSNARIQELEAAGKTVNIQGIFWFQGEGDAVNGTQDDYEDNFTELVAAFRNDFGSDLPVIAAEILELQAPTIAERGEINDALNSVALDDPLVSVVQVSDLGRVDLQHLSPEGYLNLADRFSASFAATAVSVPEPSSIALLGFGMLGLVSRRSRRTVYN